MRSSWRVVALLSAHKELLDLAVVALGFSFAKGSLRTAVGVDEPEVAAGRFEGRVGRVVEFAKTMQPPPNVSGAWILVPPLTSSAALSPSSSMFNACMMQCKELETSWFADRPAYIWELKRLGAIGVLHRMAPPDSAPVGSVPRPVRPFNLHAYPSDMPVVNIRQGNGNAIFALLALNTTVILNISSTGIPLHSSPPPSFLLPPFSFHLSSHLMLYVMYR